MAAGVRGSRLCLRHSRLAGPVRFRGEVRRSRPGGQPARRLRHGRVDRRTALVYRQGGDHGRLRARDRGVASGRGRPAPPGRRGGERRIGVPPGAAGTIGGVLQTQTVQWLAKRGADFNEWPRPSTWLVDCAIAPAAAEGARTEG